MLTKVIDQSKIDHFAKWLERADKIVIVAHVAPDGDAVGSSLGLWHFLNTQDKVDCHCSQCFSRFPEMDAR